MYIPFLNKSKVKATNTTNTNSITIINESSSFLASSDNKIIEYTIKGNPTPNKVMVKDVGHVLQNHTRKSLPKNTIYYEVTIADLMKKLNLKTVKKMLITDFAKNPKKQYVASEWEKDLTNYTSFMLWKGKALEIISTFLPTASALKYWLAFYEQKDITPQQKEFYKMCACLVAVGMLDLKPGDNIMANKEGYPVAVDTGFSYFTDNPKEQYRLEEWKECIDILKNHKDKEVNEWGGVIESYKDYILNIAEKKGETIIAFQNIIEETGKKRCEIILPENKPKKIPHNKVEPYNGQITSKPCSSITSSSKALV